MAAELVMPIAAYMPTEDEYTKLQRTHGIIVQRCMAEKGFDWEPPAPRTGDAFGRQVSRRYRYVLDRDIAAEFGYHLVGAAEADQQAEPLADAEARALAGDDEEFREESGGCTGAAIERIADGMEYVEAGGLNLPYPVYEVNVDSYARSQRDPLVRTALDEWVACMAERGYEVPDPVEYLPPELDIDSPEPSTTEIDMALWDVRCQERTDIVDVWFAVESRIQQRLLDERAAVFAQIERENAELRLRSAEILESAG
ncbi:hypothetical protein [Actinophytocola sediminis]